MATPTAPAPTPETPAPAPAAAATEPAAKKPTSEYMAKFIKKFKALFKARRGAGAPAGPPAAAGEAATPAAAATPATPTPTEPTAVAAKEAGSELAAPAEHQPEPGLLHPHAHETAEQLCTEPSAVDKVRNAVVSTVEHALTEAEAVAGTISGAVQDELSKFKTEASGKQLLPPAAQG